VQFGSDPWVTVTAPAGGFARVLVYAADGADDVAVAAAVAVPAILDGGAGNDTLAGGGGADVVVGGAGDDSLQAVAGDDVLLGGEGSDTLRGGAGADRLDGGAGNDSISGGAGNDYLIGGAGDDAAHGGAGDDILVGGDGDDLLIGGAGRDLMVGGFGADRLAGNADEDILIAGFTAFDADPAALGAIMTVWCGTGDYAARVTAVGTGVGVAGGYRLVGDDGANQTVFNDGQVDVLHGDQGRDWFFANQFADDGGVLDVVADLAGSEVWSDTDF
jgi:Ca2+-binding RTX toxin-like protein